MCIIFIILYIFSFDWNPWVESRSRHTIFFFNESLCCATLENIGREVAPQCFLFQSKSTSHTEVAPLCFYFQTHFPFSRYRRGQRSHHVLFSLHIMHPTWATREWNSTAPAPFSPSLLDMKNLVAIETIMLEEDFVKSWLWPCLHYRCLLTNKFLDMRKKMWF